MPKFEVTLEIANEKVVQKFEAHDFEENLYGFVHFYRLEIPDELSEDSKPKKKTVVAINPDYIIMIQSGDF